MNKPNGTKGPDLSMQVPLVCPGKNGQPCGTNVFDAVQVVFYTRHRLKPADRRFDSAIVVGSRYRCSSCGHVLTQEDFNSPIDLKLENGGSK